MGPILCICYMGVGEIRDTWTSEMSSLLHELLVLGLEFITKNMLVLVVVVLINCSPPTLTFCFLKLENKKNTSLPRSVVHKSLLHDLYGYSNSNGLPSPK